MITQLDHPGLARCGRSRQRGQCFVEGEVIGTTDAEDGFGTSDVLGVCAALTAAAPRAVDENEAHRQGGNSEPAKWARSYHCIRL